MNYKIQVCKSGAGYYIGQLDRDGFPYSRLSDRYYPTREDASLAMKEGFTLRLAGENEKLLHELVALKELEVFEASFTLYARVPLKKGK